MSISPQHILRFPQTSLFISFLTWKSLLIIIALTSPGPGYDTSTTLLPKYDDLPQNSTASSTILNRLSLKLVRWDAIYFTQVAQRGYVYEQEWFLGWGFARLITLIERGLQATNAVVYPNQDPQTRVALVGIAIAHVSHLLSVLTLFTLSKSVFAELSQGYPRRATVLGLISGFLHIISPAGMFLSAPYAESLFSFLQFSGYYLYAQSKLMMVYPSSHWLIAKKDLYVLSSGMVFGLATSVRSNGLLSGILYAYDAVEEIISLLRSRSLYSMRLGRFFSTILAGLSVAAGAIYPQYLAYLEFCTGSQARNEQKLSPWCSHYPPSIYAWVQQRYWNVGFLRYWTLSNIPLFAIATPMLFILIRSTTWAWVELSDNTTTTTTTTTRNSFNSKSTSNSNSTIQRPLPTNDHLPSSSSSSSINPHTTTTTTISLIRLLSLPQFILAILALTTYHVQIITRLSSGYPVWYWWLATNILRSSNNNNNNSDDDVDNNNNNNNNTRKPRKPHPGGKRNLLDVMLLQEKNRDEEMPLRRRRRKKNAAEAEEEEGGGGESIRAKIRDDGGGGEGEGGEGRFLQKWDVSPRIVVRWMIVYAMVQGSLFASFLPPA